MRGLNTQAGACREPNGPSRPIRGDPTRPPPGARTCAGAEADPADEAAAGQRGTAGPDPPLARVHADEAAGAAGLHGHQAAASARRRGLLTVPRRRTLGAVPVVEAEEAAGLYELTEVGAELCGAQRGRDAAHQAVPNAAAITAERRHLAQPARRALMTSVAEARSGRRLVARRG